MERPERILLAEAGYEFQEEIGRGASGIVYRARQVLLDRVVALKRITSGGESDPVTTHRIEVEVAALVRLEHPLVVRVFDVVTLPGEVWIVMENVDGLTLSSVLERRERPLDPPDALAVIESLARGLSHVAGAGIVHRDLKPANVFVTYDGRVKIADFGVASLRAKVEPPAAAGGTSDNTARWTRPGTILGTPAYLAPEQAAGRSDVDSRADLYSLGVIAFELFAGRVPFVYHGNLFALLAAHQSGEIPRLRDFRQDLPAEIEPVVRKALGKRACDRQVSAEAFWVELDQAATRAWPSWRATCDLAGLAASSRRAPRSKAGATLPRPSGLAPSEATVWQPEAGTTLIEAPHSVEAKPNPAVFAGGEVPRSHRRPSRTRRRSRGTHRVRAGVLAAAAAVAGYVLVGALLAGPTTGLSVGAISLGVVGSCSAGTQQATATLRTNGAAGVVVFRWRETGRDLGSLRRTSVLSGDRYVRLRFNLGHTRRPEPRGASLVTFQVLSPGPARAAALSIRAGC